VSCEGETLAVERTHPWCDDAADCGKQGIATPDCVGGAWVCGTQGIPAPNCVGDALACGAVCSYDCGASTGG
jgi:hypothetical protein